MDYRTWRTYWTCKWLENYGRTWRSELNGKVIDSKQCGFWCGLLGIVTYDIGRRRILRLYSAGHHYIVFHFTMESIAVLFSYLFSFFFPIVFFFVLLYFFLFSFLAVCIMISFIFFFLLLFVIFYNMVWEQ
jgi:hypothetical protein